MKTKTLLTITATIFSIIAVLHLIRALIQIPAQFGTWQVPMWLSWVIFVVAGFLAYSAWTARE